MSNWRPTIPFVGGGFNGGVGSDTPIGECDVNRSAHSRLHHICHSSTKPWAVPITSGYHSRHRVNVFGTKSWEIVLRPAWFHHLTSVLSETWSDSREHRLHSCRVSFVSIFITPKSTSVMYRRRFIFTTNIHSPSILIGGENFLVIITPCDIPDRMLSASYVSHFGWLHTICRPVHADLSFWPMSGGDDTYVTRQKPIRLHDISVN